MEGSAEGYALGQNRTLERELLKWEVRGGTRWRRIPGRFRSRPWPVAHPFANLLENIERRGLRVERLLPIHGGVVPFADLVAAARAGSR